MSFAFISILFFWGISDYSYPQDFSKSKSVMTMDSSFTMNKSNLFNSRTSYVGDFAGNLSGGKRTGAVYLGMANIELEIETGKLGLWKGGDLFLKGAATHGGLPSENLIGDFQVASNIEAGTHTFIQEFWYKQSFANFDIKLGLQDLNADFIVSDYAGDFMNSSFGVPSLISDNVPLPIFPLTTLGINLKSRISDAFTIQTALFDGMPESFDNNEYNLDWSIKSGDGALIFSELQFSTSINKLEGTYKAGSYYHSHLKCKNEVTGCYETVFKRNYGFYIIMDQRVWKKGEFSSLGLFAQFAVSPSAINPHHYYFSAGLNYSGLFDDNGDDVVGLAFAHAGFGRGEISDEMTIELFYKARVNENLFLQPDVQYIINPAGAGVKLDNALAAFLRFGINL